MRYKILAVKPIKKKEKSCRALHYGTAYHRSDLDNEDIISRYVRKVS